jgi:antibiotic biosynthesis monooxygenase
MIGSLFSRHIHRKEPVMYASIRKYYVIPGHVDEWMRRVQAGFVPIISNGPGFIAYYALQVRDDEAVTVSIFDTQAGAETSVRQAADWVAKNLESLNQGLPEITVGQVRVSQVNWPPGGAAKGQNPVMPEGVSDSTASQQTQMPKDDHGPYYPSVTPGTQT